MLSAVVDATVATFLRLDPAHGRYNQVPRRVNLLVHVERVGVTADAPRPD
jgi:hypothetical protein